MDDLKLCPSPQDVSWNPGVSTAKSLCASTVAFRPGSYVSDMTPTPSVDVSGWEETDSHHVGSVVLKEFDSPIDLTGHILSPFYIRPLDYQDSRFHSIAHLMCYRYAVCRCWAENICNRHKKHFATYTKHSTVVNWTVHSVICFTCPGTFVNYNFMLVCPVISDSVPDSIQGDYRLYPSRALI